MDGGGTGGGGRARRGKGRTGHRGRGAGRLKKPLFARPRLDEAFGCAGALAALCMDWLARGARLNMYSGTACALAPRPITSTAREQRRPPSSRRRPALCMRVNAHQLFGAHGLCCCKFRFIYICFIKCSAACIASELLQRPRGPVGRPPFSPDPSIAAAHSNAMMMPCCMRQHRCTPIGVTGASGLHGVAR